MPRYHFTSVLDDYDGDPDGIVLADVGQARIRAIHYAGDMLMTYTGTVDRVGSARIDVTDALGHVVCTVLTTVTDHARGSTGFDPASPSNA